MTTSEFSDEFDIMLDSLSKDNKITLDEYEKSVFLTKAQEELILELYKGTVYNEGFEQTELNREYLNNLIEEANLERYDSLDRKGIYEKGKSIFYKLPKNLLAIIYEEAKFGNIENNKCLSNTIVSVMPITHDSYHKLHNNPFRGANDHRVLRLMNKDMIELITNYNLSNYFIRYLEKPSPIILVNLPEGVTINEKQDKTECILNSALHREILNRAVKLAIISKSISARNV